MSVILKDSSNTVVYTLPAGLELVDESWEQRVEFARRAYAHGAVITGDEKIEPRLLIVSGTYHSATEANLKALKKACYSPNLRLYGTQNSDEFYEISCKSFITSYDKELITTKVKVIIVFLCVNPFRLYKDETTDTHDLVSSPDADTIANDGDVEVYPVITITGGASTSTTKVRILNADDGSKYFDYSGTITTGDIIEIDCKEGTVTKNGSSDMANWLGSFLNLASGDNAITTTVTGVTGTITILWTFRKRYL